MRRILPASRSTMRYRPLDGMQVIIENPG